MIRRVPVREDEQGCPFLVGRVYQRKLRGLTGRPAFRVIAQPRRQRLSEVTHREAVAEEGFQGRRALEAWRLEWVRWSDSWARRHRTASDEDVLRRWRMKHAAQECWVLEFDLLDRVRCMADQRDILSGRTQHGKLSGPGEDQYVASGGIDPYAEGVDEGTLARIVAGELGATPVVSRRERRALRRQRLFEGEG